MAKRDDPTNGISSCQQFAQSQEERLRTFKWKAACFLPWLSDDDKDKQGQCTFGEGWHPLQVSGTEKTVKVCGWVFLGPSKGYQYSKDFKATTAPASTTAAKHPWVTKSRIRCVAVKPASQVLSFGPLRVVSCQTPSVLKARMSGAAHMNRPKTEVRSTAVLNFKISTFSITMMSWVNPVEKGAG